MDAFGRRRYYRRTVPPYCFSLYVKLYSAMETKITKVEELPSGNWNLSMRIVIKTKKTDLMSHVGLSTQA